METFFNVAYFGLPFLFFGPIIFGYRTFRPKYYGLLGWSLILILCASLLFGLYSESLEQFFALTGLKADEEIVRTRLSANLRVLTFIVPGIMLGIAANLITQFLNAPDLTVQSNGGKLRP
jgi:hypothetical protein